MIRAFLAFLLLSAFPLSGEERFRDLQSRAPSGAERLPLSTTFKGQDKFHRIARKAAAGNWRALPVGDRIARVARELEGTPYKPFTLEIHDRIESPSVNLHGLDCWTFFEACLAFSRMLETPKAAYAPRDLLREIEWTRYRGGSCRGNYLDRLHYLAEWYLDNAARGNVADLTRRFPHRPVPSECSEMSKLWRSYRYLAKNPALRRGMAAHERRLNAMAVVMVPKEKVAGIERSLRNGDIIGIARNDGGSYCSHVGIIVRDARSRARFMHASSTHKKVLIDTTLAAYLARHRKQAGVLVARPLPASKAIRDPAAYRRNLQRLTKRK